MAADRAAIHPNTGSQPFLVHSPKNIGRAEAKRTINFRNFHIFYITSSNKLKCTGASAIEDIWLILYDI